MDRDMDREALLRLAASLQEAAARNMRIPLSLYTSLRNRVFAYVGDDADLDAMLPMKPPTGYQSEDVINGDDYLSVAAVYLRELATRAPGLARITASTDLMEQAESLMADPDVHVAAPIVLAGAALEEVLRDLVEGRDLKIKGKPGLTAYSQTLRTADLLRPNDVKEITSLAGVRNEAAHGNFEDLTRERAQLFLDRINLMLQKLTSS